MIGLLTRRLESVRDEAPYLDYSPGVYRVVFKAICYAWRELLDEEGEAVLERGEVQLTAGLHELLESFRCSVDPVVAGFTSLFFETVQRDASLLNYDGRHLEKQPDLTFRLRDRNPGLGSHYRGIFVECKRVDHRARSIRLYCEEGVGRFVRGEYAWAMPTGVMVAYVRGGSSVSKNLAPFLARSRTGEGDPFCTKVLPETRRFGDSAIGVHSSRHGRPHSSGDGRPGDIELHHLWLRGE